MMQDLEKRLSEIEKQEAVRMERETYFAHTLQKTAEALENVARFVDQHLNIQATVDDNRKMVQDLEKEHIRLETKMEAYFRFIIGSIIVGIPLVTWLFDKLLGP